MTDYGTEHEYANLALMSTRILASGSSSFHSTNFWKFEQKLLLVLRQVAHHAHC
jgi:hypothetical protein